MDETEISSEELDRDKLDNCQRDDDEDNDDEEEEVNKGEPATKTLHMEEEEEEEEEEDDEDEEVIHRRAPANKTRHIEEEEEEEEDDVNHRRERARKTLLMEEEEEEEEEEDDVNYRRERARKTLLMEEEEEEEEEEEDEVNSRRAPANKTRHIEEEEEKEEEDEEEAEKEGEEEEEAEKEEEEEEEEEEAEKEEEEEEEEDDEVDRRRETSNNTLYDFDIMMAKKKEENSRKRRRRDYDIINDNDDIIAEIMNQMKDAVEQDSEANRNKMAATKKLKLLPFVISQMRKVDLRDAFLDSGVLSVITEWLAPLPDRSLPHLAIRENLLKILIDFNLYDVDRIKSSGIGKAIMYLYKHPKETRENKQRAKQLISCWSRPIFQLDSSFNAISREEREQRDLELMSKQRRTSKTDSPDGAGPSSGSRRKEDPAQKPGDKGWIPRARVPAPSMRDYVIRPRSKVDGDIGKSSKRPANMLEKYMKNAQERRRANRQQRAINMKIDRV